VNRIDVLIRREVRRWQRAGQDPGDNFRGLYLADDQAQALAERPFGTSWGHLVDLPAEEEQVFTAELKRAIQEARRVLELAHRQERITRLEHLAQTFNLNRFDLDALLICLAPSLDLRYERLYGYLQDDVSRKYPSVSLVLDLLCRPGAERLTRLVHFADEAPLFHYRLLEQVPGPDATSSPLLGRSLHPDPAIVAWLLGNYQPHAELRPYAHLVLPQLNERDLLLAHQAWPQLERAIDREPIVVCYGPNQAAQQAAARLVSARVGRPLLQVNLGAAVATGESPRPALELALRDALLIGAIPHLVGWDACLVEGAAPPDLLSLLCAFPHLTVIGGQTTWQAQGIARDRTLLWIDFPVPDYNQRKTLWQYFVDRQSPGVEFDFSELSGQFVLTTGQIRDAVATARDLAAQRGDGLNGEDLFAAARIHSNPRLSGLARKIDPRYTWDDIILPPDQLTILHEIVSTVRGRPKVLEEWGVGKKLASSVGVTVLFSGPPGTGKTMAAEVVANELKLDLYKIDLSTVVSKYIGETEKNLERIFSEAQSSNAILFFDEADALFGKRSEVKDAHDRYANIEVSYLLQRMETYDGVTVLATNLRANLDEAFTRRLQFALDFPFPEEEYRLRIWKTLFPADVPRAPELDLELMAQRFKLAGGSIRNVLVSASFLAAADSECLTMEHLLHGTRRELQKMGRLVDEKDLSLD
jgi:hypothetical protein